MCHTIGQKVVMPAHYHQIFTKFALIFKRIMRLNAKILIGFTFFVAALLLTPATIAAAHDFTVVIDPGHGGKDYGASGKRSHERSINLGVALKLGKLISSEMKDTKVVYTRNNDTFVTLQGRANIANKANGDLFISIHTNSVDKRSRNRNSVRGASVYTLGFSKSKENLEVAMRENSVMKLEADYTTTYEGFDPSSTESYIIFEMSQNMHMEQSINAAQAIQNELISTAGRIDRGVRQANYWVLFKTSMPAILVELDFICNPTQESYMASEDGQKALATAIYNGLVDYKNATYKGAAKLAKKKSNATESSDRNKENNTENNTENKSDEITVSDTTDTVDKDNGHEASAAEAGAITYKVQILTSPKKLPSDSREFKGLSPVKFYKDGSLMKYYFDSGSTMAEATDNLRKIKKKFPDAFIIKIRDGNRVK